MKLELKEIGTDNLDFIGSAIDHGIESIKEGGVLVPFLFTLQNENKELHRFQSDTTLNSIQAAEKYVNKINPKPEIVALVYEGRIGAENQKKDAILAKVWLMKKILIFAQPFVRNEKDEISIHGDYLYLESKENSNI